MSKVDEIEKAVAQLAPEDLARFRVWFEEFEAKRFDDRIQRDLQAGRLDKAADAALAEFRKGGAREL